MKTLLSLVLIALFFLPFEAMAQNRAERREQRRQQERQLRAEVARIVGSENFSLLLVFHPEPNLNLSGGGAIMQDKRIVTVRNDSIFGALPFIGRSTVSVYQSTGGGGFEFSDPIQMSEIKTRNRDFYISLLVHHPGESLRITIKIGFSGEATMTIQSNRRARARYLGSLIFV